MSTIRTALVDADGIVTNVTLVDPASSWQPPEGLTPIQLADDSAVGPGWTRDDGQFFPPAAPAPEPATKPLPTVIDLQAQVDALTDMLLSM